MNEKLLLDETTSMLIVEERKRKDIVIGSPHHTPGGVGEMKFCPDHKAGDENAGLIAYRIAELLDVSYAIACNYHIDSNKKLTTDYATLIKRWKPKYLIEIHGHGGGNANFDIEISSGKDTNKRNNTSIKFATILKRKMDKHKELKKYSVSGDINAIYYKAKKDSKTITTNLWIPFHIELPRQIRKDAKNPKKLPRFINVFINYLKETIDEVCV